MSRKTKCEMCGARFDLLRDSRRWKASATPLAGDVATKPKPFIACTDCFLQIAEAEYGVD